MKKLISLLLVLLVLTSTVFAVEGEDISVALIDTGISTKIIAQDSILTGKNYVREGYDTEDTIGHGTAIAGLILQHAPDAQLVPLTYCDRV